MDLSFTDVAAIDEFLANDNTITPEDKKKRMKMEVQYARDTSMSIPRSNPIFQIRTKKQQGKKARDLTAEEFGENLKSLINKKMAAMGKEVSIADFVSTLDTL